MAVVDHVLEEVTYEAGKVDEHLVSSLVAILEGDDYMVS